MTTYDDYAFSVVDKLTDQKTTTFSKNNMQNCLRYLSIFSYYLKCVNKDY